MIRYYDLGGDRRLNEIVMAGSHDAGITSGGANVQTQDLKIDEQAAAGVRLFDLRIAGEKVSGQRHGDDKVVKLRAFHANEKLVKDEVKTRYAPDVGRTQDVTRSKLSAGEFGLGLSRMLKQARRFVKGHTSEFLLLKFDKCRNWDLIAEVCGDVLGDVLYTGGGNLNTTRLRKLKGKVVVLFTREGLDAIPTGLRGAGGILGIKNLKGGGTYDPDYQGLQYTGKGGTSVARAYGKIGENVRKQRKLMSEGAAGDPNVMGMMYWTTTGLNESIRDRNDLMWNARNVKKLKALWRGGLSEAIEERIANHIDPTSYASAPILKTFMPNFVMIDFADAEKCKVIYRLNRVAATELTEAARQVNAEVEELRAQYAQLEKRWRK